MHQHKFSLTSDTENERHTMRRQVWTCTGCGETRLEKLALPWTSTPSSNIDREGLIAQPVTLNGNRAKISGYLNDFATVTDTTTRLSCEFAWSTVERICANGGRFQS